VNDTLNTGSLARKIGLKEGHRLMLVGAPPGWSIEGSPKDVRVTRKGNATSADIVIAFFRDLVTMQEAVPRLARKIFPDGALWLAWPRRAAGHKSDITDNGIRSVVLPLGLVDIKVAALDDDWSGLKVVWRKERRQ